MNPTKLKGEINFVLFRLIYIKATQKHLFMPVHFSDREMKNAWKHNFEAYKKLQPSYTNAHRLLLFYSTECGLKATLMKRESANNTEDCASLIALIKSPGKDGHNINKLLDALCAGYDLKLPPEINMTSKRTINRGEINQMWRYGGKVANVKNQNSGLVEATDEDLKSACLKYQNGLNRSYSYEIFKIFNLA